MVKIRLSRTVNGGHLDPLLSSKYREDGVWPQPSKEPLNRLLDFEVARENMNFMDNEHRLTKMIFEHMERDLAQQKSAVPVEGYEGHMCVNLHYTSFVFGLARKWIIRYMVAHYVLERNEMVFKIGSTPHKNRDTNAIVVDHFFPLKDEKGVGVDLHSARIIEV